MDSVELIERTKYKTPTAIIGIILNAKLLYRESQKKRNPHKINYVFAEIIIHNNVIIIDNSLMNLTFLCLWDFIFFVQYKSK